MPSVIMAKKIGVSRTTICAIAKESKIRVNLSVTSPRSKKDVMEERVKWIRANGERLTMNEIAARLGIAYGCVYGMVHLHNLTVKDDPSAPGYNVVRPEGRLFNVHGRENWLV